MDNKQGTIASDFKGMEVCKVERYDCELIKTH